MLLKLTLRGIGGHAPQIVEAKQAGAAGVLGTIACVLGKGAPTMSSFAAAVGLDCPVEVC